LEARLELGNIVLGVFTPFVAKNPIV